jgi:hypothetical protein
MRFATFSTASLSGPARKFVGVFRERPEQELGTTAGYFAIELSVNSTKNFRPGPLRSPGTVTITAS